MAAADHGAYGFCLLQLGQIEHYSRRPSSHDVMSRDARA